MPWKHDSVNSRRTGRWQRLSKQTRKGEPLCRLCLSAGRVEPATVVDHIVPLAEGGTHATENLMPLCKRCHDTIKTPADNAEMLRAVPLVIRLCWPAERSSIPATLNAIEMRFSLAAKIDAAATTGHLSESAGRFGMRQAHELTMAAVDGIARACKHGQVAAAAVIVVMDDSAVANRLRACYGAEVEEIPHHDSQEQDTRREGRWIEVFRSSERARRSSFGIGQQTDRAGSD